MIQYKKSYSSEIVVNNDKYRSNYVRFLRVDKYFPLLWISVVPGLAQADSLDLGSFNDLAQRCGSTVAPSTLAAVAKTESGFETLVVSDNTTGKSHTYPTVEQAAPVVEHLIAGGDSVDIGLMQINSANLKRLGMTVRDALDACKSINGAASILTSNYLGSRGAATAQIQLRDAISQYNTGNRVSGYRNGYVRKVEQAAKALAPVSITSVAGNGNEGQADDDNSTSEAWDIWASERPPPIQDAAINSTNVDMF